MSLFFRKKCKQLIYRQKRKKSTPKGCNERYLRTIRNEYLGIKYKLYPLYTFSDDACVHFDKLNARTIQCFMTTLNPVFRNQDTGHD